MHFKSDGDECWGNCVGASLLGGESGVWVPVGAGQRAEGRANGQTGCRRGGHSPPGSLGGIHREAHV